MRNPLALYNTPPPREPPDCEIITPDAALRERMRLATLARQAAHAARMASDPVYKARVEAIHGSNPPVERF